VAVPDRLVVASRNTGKIREIRRICADWPTELLTFEDVDWPDVEETEDTYLGNALLKARAVAAATGMAALADDSGIEVDALGGKPGPRSARFAGDGASDAENLAALLQAIAGVPAGGRTARYRAVAVVAWPGGETAHAEATCEGTIARKPRGEDGFGYDPAFLPEGWDRTMAELTAEEKDRISHRGRSLRALAEALRGPLLVGEEPL
jgi:XTP/dITP diphosphohydrolase